MFSNLLECSSAATSKHCTVICPPWAVCWGSGQDRGRGSESCHPPCASGAGSKWDPGTLAHSACALWSHWTVPAKTTSSFTGNVTQIVAFCQKAWRRLSAELSIMSLMSLWWSNCLTDWPDHPNWGVKQLDALVSQTHQYGLTLWLNTAIFLVSLLQMPTSCAQTTSPPPPPQQRD